MYYLYNQSDCKLTPRWPFRIPLSHYSGISITRRRIRTYPQKRHFSCNNAFSESPLVTYDQMGCNIHLSAWFTTPQPAYSPNFQINLIQIVHIIILLFSPETVSNNNTPECPTCLCQEKNGVGMADERNACRVGWGSSFGESTATTV